MSGWQAKAAAHRDVPAAAADPGLGAHPLLVALTVGGAVGETLALDGLALHPGPPLGPQVTAVPPFAIFHDLRWVMAFHDSWLTFAAAMALLLAFRSAALALLARAAWPHDAPRPGWQPSLGSAFAATCVGLVLLTPAAALLFTMAVAPVYYFFLAAFGIAIVPILLLAQTALPIAWWRRLPSLRAIAWTALSGIVLTLGSLAVNESPRWLTLLPAGGCGVFEALAWYAIACAVAPGERPQVRLLPIAAGIAAPAAVCGIAFGIAFALNASTLHERAHAAAGRVAAPILYVDGFRSRYPPGVQQNVPASVDSEKFSYRGIGPGGEPLPYEPDATYESLGVLARKLGAQVDAMHARTGRPVVLLAASEGSLVAKSYLLATPHPPVDLLVMTSPLLEPGRVYYPAPGHDGWGVATRFALRRLTDLISAAGVPVTPSMPFLRSLVDCAPALRAGMSAAVPGVRQTAFLPLVNALTEPVRGGDVPTVVLPALHGEVTRVFRDAVALALDGQLVPQFAQWKITEHVIRGAAAGWNVPSLPLALNPLWRDGGAGCGLAIRVRLAKKRD